MNRTAKWALTAGAVAGGAAVGYLAERTVLRQRLGATEPGEVPIGSLAGEVREVEGPDGLRITVEAYGPEDAPQIVFAHGWVCTGRVWHEQVMGLAEDHRLITYDQPGHGRSTSPRSHEYHLDLFGDTLAAVLRQATAPGPLVLCGHSLGGMTILNMLRRHPDLVADRVRALALLSTTSHAAARDVQLGVGIHSLARIERVVRRALRIGNQVGVADVADRFYRSSTDLSFVLTRFFALSRQTDPRYVDFTEQLLLDSDFEMMSGLLGPILQLDEDEALPCIAVPTLLLCGTDDKLTPIGLTRRMAERCATAELVELPGVGHMTPLEAGAEVNDALRTLVSRTVVQAA